MLQLEKINEYLYLVTNTGSCNIGVCVKDGSALVIDSGYLPLAAEKVVQLIREQLGCEVEWLVNTHYHADHTFGNQAFSCPILASQATADNMRACLLTYWHRDIIKKEMDEEPAMAEAWRDLKITLPTDAFDREKSFDFKGLSVILKKVGGHTNDSSIVFFPDFKTLFCGDIVFNRIYPTLLRHDGHPFKLIEVLKGLLVMDIDTIVPGHGAVGDKSIVEKSIDYWVCLTGKIRQHIDDHLDDKRIREKILGECRLGGIPFNKRRHQKNVDSVIFFLRKQLNAACSRTQAI